jgi:tetratricopeptide (TPR) repeat protein
MAAMASDVRPTSRSPLEALPGILAAVRRSPNNPRVLLDHARCLLALGRLREASDAAASALEFAPPDAALLDAIGGTLNFAGNQHGALMAYDRAVTLSPEQPHFLFNRAAIYRFLGNLEAAEQDYDRVIALRPLDFEAWRNRSELRVQTPMHNHVQAMETLLPKASGNRQGEVELRYALAKEYEDLGQHTKSFSHLLHGAQLRRAPLRYDVAIDVATVDWIIEAFPPKATAIAAAPATESDMGQPDTGRPIFILGMPRSGSTLVERILSSHPQVKSGGEMPYFALSLVGTIRRQAGGAALTRRDLVERSAHLDFEALGREYLERVHATGIRSANFIDKMPLNYLYCGLIAKALPQARIVHVQRDPMAACYAMYKTLFKDGYPFSYDLRELARVYAAYRRLMSHWETAFPGTIRVLNYEDLVRDPERETRSLLSCLGLPWDNACTEFHLNPAPSTTASAARVRQAVYDTSVAQWRHYERQLMPLRDLLRAEGIPLDGTDAR